MGPPHPVGALLSRVIANALQTAKCVVVAWSKLSVAGQWVLEEADAGKSCNVRLPAMVEEVQVPRIFRHIEAGRLIGWSGVNWYREWEIALNAVAHYVGRAPGGPPKPFATQKAATTIRSPCATTDVRQACAPSSAKTPSISIFPTGENGRNND